MFSRHAVGLPRSRRGSFLVLFCPQAVNLFARHSDQAAYFFSLAGAHLNLRSFGDSPTPVGHSTGGGEVERYVGRHGARRLPAGPRRHSAPILLESVINPKVFSNGRIIGTWFAN
jgi:hypothetical protein